MGMTTSETNATKADRFTKAALAALEAARLPQLNDENRETLRLEAETALRAASNYSKLALADAIDRSFPSFPHSGMEFTSGGVDLMDDEVAGRIREHVLAHETSVGRHRAEEVTNA